MKRLTPLLFVLVSSITGCDENEPLPRIENFRMVRKFNYSTSTSAIPYGKVEFEYDSRGNVVKESMFDYPGLPTGYITYEYSGERLINKRMYYRQAGHITLATYIHYSYTHNRVTKEELFLSDGTSKYKTYYEFDGDNLVNTYKVDDDLGIHHQFKYEFDNLNRLILEETFMYNEELSGFTKHYYDNSNRLVKSEVYNHNRNITSSVEKIYNGASKLPAEELYFDQDGIQTQRRKLTYDNLGNLTEITVNGHLTICSRRFKGELLIEAITYNPYFGGSEWIVSRYEYQRK